MDAKANAEARTLRMLVNNEVLRIVNGLKGKIDQFDGYATPNNVGDEMCKALGELGYRFRWNAITKQIEEMPERTG